MSTVVDYKGLQILSPDPTGDGGELIQSNFKKIADELQTLSGGSGGGSGVDPDSVQTQNITSNGFALTHNNKKILNLTSDGGTYFSASIDPGTTVGQRLLIIILPNTDADLNIRNNTTNTTLLGSWVRNSDDEIFSWLSLEWDGASWDEVDRDHNRETSANGMYSRADGRNTSADGLASTAVGRGSNAGSDYSFASGRDTTVAGRNAHVEGEDTLASGDDSHAEGSDTIAGPQADSFTITGVTITIGGDVTGHYAQSDQIHVYQLFGGTNNTRYIDDATIVSVPVFGGGNTTFDVSGAFDDRTGGVLVNSSHGSGAHAEGLSTIASETAAHAEGSSTLASGNSSHAEGSSTTAGGPSSHAEGESGRARGTASHVEGINGSALGDSSHSEGNSSFAAGDASHAEGAGRAFGDRAHGEGDSTNASGRDSHAEGNAAQTGNTPRTFTLSGSTVTIAGDVTFEFTNGHTIRLYDLSGGINNTLFSTVGTISSNPVFASGNTTFNISASTDDRTDGSCVDTTVGQYAHAEGNSARAQKESAHAEGETTLAQGQASHSEGSSSLAVGPASHAEGNGTAIGASSHAEGGTGGNKAGGGSLNASAAYSHAEGVNTTAGNTPRACSISGTIVTISNANALSDFTNGNTVRFWNISVGGSFITADRTISSLNYNGTDTTFHISSAITSSPSSGVCVDPTFGETSHAEGNVSQAKGTSSHAEGDTTLAAGATAHAEGTSTVARGDHSHAEGQSTAAYGDSAHVEGATGRAVGDASHAEGASSALANSSHAEGNSVAAGTSSHSEGSAAVGYAASSFTVSVTTVTIGGDVTAQFRNGDSVAFYDLTGGSVATLFKAIRTINSVVFFAGQTTFGIGSALSDRTAGLCASLSFGADAHAEGTGRALGTFAHAEGGSTLARGDASHAEGSGTTATGASHAEGVSTQSVGDGSHSEGSSTSANDASAHSEGSSTSANANSSHAEGTGCTASGVESHAEGNNSLVGYQPVSFTITGNTVTIAGVDVTSQFANGDSVNLFNLTGGVHNTVFSLATSINSPPVFGVDTTFNIAATPDDRTGGSIVDVSIGQAAHAEGSQSQALQIASHAQGDSALAWTKQNMRGMSAQAGGAFATPGDAQFIRYILRTATTDNSPHQVQDPDNFIMRSGSGYAITATVYAKEDIGGTNQHAMYKRMLIIDTTGFITVQPIGTDIGTNAGAPPAGWTLNFLNNGSNLQVNVNGNGFNVHWVVVLEAVEINGL